MSFGKRFLYFGFGLFLGILVVNFVWDKKNSTFCYLPTCRVLKDLRNKKLLPDQQTQFKNNNFLLDTLGIQELLLNGTVDFDKSETKTTPCKLYKIDGIYKKENYTMFIKNCDSTMVIKEISTQ